MGKSKIGCVNQAAKWQSTGCCGCSENNYLAQKVIWKSVPMKGQVWAIAVRIASLGFLQIWHKGRQYSHDCIQAWVNCSKCNKFMYATMDFSKQGKQIRWGRYNKIKTDSNAVSQAGVNYPFSVVRRQYDRMPNSGYKLCSYNCKDWAKSLWKCL